jgi:hypothetical protein
MIVWRKSSHSGTSVESDCVEVAGLPGRSLRVIGVRDSKDPDGPYLAFDLAAFRQFIEAVQDGPTTRKP